MAEVNVKEERTSEVKDQSLQKHESERGLAGGHRWDPFAFSLTPSDFFNADPFSIMRRFHHEMDRTFGRFFGDGTQSGTESSVWSPAIEVAQKDGKLEVHADLPGLKLNDVKVEITDDALVIQGERKYEHEENKGGLYRSERRYGHFYREVPLPEGANSAQAKAEFRDGVLEVTLPVPEQKSNRRTIPIGTGSAESTSAANSAARKEQK